VSDWLADISVLLGRVIISHYAVVDLAAYVKFLTNGSPDICACSAAAS
jgi:hypothetical protein